jgi:nitronate monooxygenase
MAPPPIGTTLTDRLGLRWPIVQAPIGSGTTPELAAAVTNAGGLGTLSITWEPLDRAREAIEAARSLADGPIGVNVVLDPASKWLSTDEQLSVVEETEVEVVSLSFGDAAPHGDRLHEAGAVVTQTVGSATEARNAVDAGVDVVVAQGWEAGGHVQSEVATMPLVPRVADAVPDTPVVAAGGIADGRGIAAALALGADGAWLGTRFVAAEEAALDERYKRRVAEAAETETVYSELFDGGWPDQPHRVLRNRTVERWEAAGRPAPGERPDEGEPVAELPNGRPVERYSDVLPMPGMAEGVDDLALYAGQSAGLTDSVRPAAEIVEALASEAVEAIGAVGSLVD